MKSDISFDFEKNDIDINNGSLSFINEGEKIMQEIALELISKKGSMSLYPSYGSGVALRLNAPSLSYEYIKSEVERVALAHEKVESIEELSLSEEKEITLKVRLMNGQNESLTL